MLFMFGRVPRERKKNPISAAEWVPGGGTRPWGAWRLERDGVAGSTPKTSSPPPERIHPEQPRCPGSSLTAAWLCWKYDYAACLLTRV